MTEQEEILSFKEKLSYTSKKLSEAEAKIAGLTTKLKEYEDEAAKAIQKNKTKSLFLASMSHELRTPLNAIEGFSRLLAEATSTEEKENFIEIIESNNARVHSLINEILDLSRVESGELQMKYSPVDLPQLMKSIKQLFKFRCPETVEMKSICPKENISMMTDSLRLTQVLSNLISNALKHTTTGFINYGYRLVQETEKIEFFVSDTGTGIDPEIINHIFDTYVSKDAEVQEGTGLGLSISKMIIDRMGGQISVESTINQGATFTVVLPFSGTIGGVSNSKRTAVVTSHAARATTQPSGKTKKLVLIAEDEESNYQLARIVLHKRYELLRAHNGIEAVTMAEEEHPDLILMDIKMPQMNGLDATRIIKEVKHDLPIIALSAFAFADDIKQAKAAGCNDFLSKPYKVEDLVAIVKKYLKD